MSVTEPAVVAEWAEYERRNHVARSTYAREQRLRALVSDLGLAAAAELLGCRLQDILWLIGEDIDGAGDAA